MIRGPLTEREQRFSVNLAISRSFNESVTDQPTDRPTDQPTDTASYRDAWAHLKMDAIPVIEMCNNELPFPYFYFETWSEVMKYDVNYICITVAKKKTGQILLLLITHLKLNQSV